MNWILNITSSTPVDRDPLFLLAGLYYFNKESTSFRVRSRIIDIKPFSAITFAECTKSAPC